MTPHVIIKTNFLKGLILMERLHLKVVIDRPIGYVDDFNNSYPINYGYVPGVIGGDGEEQDVYVISKKATTPLTKFEGKLIAIIKRHDDIETKWVMTSFEEHYSVDEIWKEVSFLEQYFDSVVELVD